MVENAAMADPDLMDEQTVTIEAPSFPPPAPPPSGPSRRWYQLPVSRDPDDHKVGGVIGGLSRSYGFDVRTTRIAVAVATLVLPVIIVLYLAAWVLLPARPAEAVSLEHIVRDRRRVPLYVAMGIVLIAGGVGSFGSWFYFGGVPWGLGLIAVGVLLWAAPSLGRSADGATTSPLPPPTPGTTGTFGTTTDATTGTTTGMWASDATRPLQVDDVRPRRKRRPVGSLVTLAVLAFVGVASAGDALGWWDIPVLTTLLVSLISTAVGIVISAIVNRSWMGIPLIAILAVVTTGLLITHPDLDGGVGDRAVNAQTVQQAERSQKLGAGELTMDLGDVPLSNEPVNVRAEVGVGHLKITVPSDATLVIDAQLGAGDVWVDGDKVIDGVRRDTQRTLQPAGVSAGTMHLDVEVGLGRIDIERAP